MNNRGQLGIILAVAIVAIIVALFGVAFYFVYTDDGNILESNNTESIDKNITMTVTKVYSGDRFQVDNDYDVSLLCVLAPTEKEYLYSEATQLLENKILNKNIILEKDNNYKSNDKFYVWVDSELINQHIVKSGFAKYNKDIIGDSKYCDSIYQSQLIAESFYQGIWGQRQNEGTVLE